MFHLLKVRAPNLAVKASAVNLMEMQILGPTPDLLNQGTLGVGPRIYGFMSLQGVSDAHSRWRTRVTTQEASAVTGEKTWGSETLAPCPWLLSK